MSSRERGSASPWSWALVTGASSGIGEEIARQLAGRGVSLVLVARSVDRLEALAAELRGLRGIDVEVLGADLASDEGCAKVVVRLADAERPIDLLVNNAGIGGVGRFWTTDLAHDEAQVRLNALAPFRLLHAALPGMVARGRGAVMNVSSLASFQPTPSNPTYGATKAFVTHLSESVNEQLRGTGVSITAVCPGYVRTAFPAAMDAVSDPDDPVGRSILSPPKFVWMSAASVARQAIDGTAAGKAIVVPGLGYRIVAGITGVLGHTGRRVLVGRLSRGGRAAASSGSGSHPPEIPQP